MRHILLAAVIVALLPTCLPSQQAPATSGELWYDKGLIKDRVYTNRCVGLTFAIPAGWEINQTPGLGEGRALRVGGSLYLLTIGRCSGKSFGDHIALNAVDATEAPGDGDAFVTASVQWQIQFDPQHRTLIHNAIPFEVGKRRFYRADYKQQFPNGETRYISYAYARFRTYFIGETLVASSPEALDEGILSLAGISFDGTAPDSRCVMGPHDGPLVGVIGAVRSSGSLTASPSGVHISSKVASNLLIERVEPQYPDAARQNKIEGLVLLQVVINADGDVEKITAISGDSVLIPPAIEAVKKWKYKPYRLNGQATKAITSVSVAFALRDQLPH